jgi:hypothetical protein
VGCVLSVVIKVCRVKENLEKKVNSGEKREHERCYGGEMSEESFKDKQELEGRYEQWKEGHYTQRE